MIGCFLYPYPDELLYSVCARYAARMMLGPSYRTVKQLFGSEAKHIGTDFPFRLNRFVNSLPPGAWTSPQWWIERTTMLSFYRMFIPQEHAQRMEQEMIRERIPGMELRGQVANLITQAPERLRFCPVCVHEDQERFGEAYWHRMHQIAGCRVCPFHSVFIETSQVPTRLREAARELIPAEDVTHDRTPRFVNLARPGEVIQLRLAKDIRECLIKGVLFPVPEEARRRYRVVFAGYGAATLQRVRWRRIYERVAPYLVPEVLQDLGYPKEGSQSRNWLKTVLCPWGRNNFVPPVLHLLVVQSLGHTPSSFATLSLDHQPFGQGPWPCLNPVAEHFQEEVIPSVALVDKGEVASPWVGHFRCACGFEYARRGPDRNPTDRLTIGKMRAYGPLWEEAFCRDWTDSSLSIPAIAQKFKAYRKTIRWHAIRLKLPFSRPNHKRSRLGPVRPNPQAVPRVVLRDTPTLEQDRAQCLELLKTHSGEVRSFYVKALPRVFWRLWRRDRVWWEQHFPSTAKVRRASWRWRDWTRLDDTLESQVRAAIEALQQTAGRPERVTVQMICRMLHVRRLSGYDFEKLPRTARTLKGGLDSPESLARRRIQWAVRDYQNQGVIPSKTQFYVKTGLYPRQAIRSLVKDMIDEALLHLHGPGIIQQDSR